MKKLFSIILFIVFFNSLCLANSKKISTFINKKITIDYGIDKYESIQNGSSEEGYQNATKYIFNSCDFFDANHKEVFPISYEGTTYLPIRAISGLLKIKIKWDGTKNTINLGEGEVDYRAVENSKNDKSDELESVEVLRNEDIKIFYNDDIQTFYDVNGKRVYPLSYNGTTYLPVRAVANLFDIVIDWDGETNTVILKRKSRSKIFGDKEIKTNLSLLTDEELEIALNELFAKYGHDFDTKRLEDYFIQKSWYKKIDGKKVEVSELSNLEKENLSKIQEEVNLRKTYKDINTVSQPNVINIKNYKIAEVLKTNDSYYTKIYDNTQDALDVKTNPTNVSNVELLPSKVYLMNDNYKFYYTMGGETYFIPIEKVNSPDEERLVLMEHNMEIYNNGDLIINGIKMPDFFNKKIIDTADSYTEYNGVIEFLLSKNPTDNGWIVCKYNFDNNLETNEYIFKVAESYDEAGNSFLTTGKKYMDTNKECTSFHIENIIDDLDYTTNIAGYSNLYVKEANGFGDMNENYSLKNYGSGTSMLNSYILENFIDVYYLYIPNHGFELVNKTLDGENVDLDKYIFTLKKDLTLYAKEKYEEEFGDLEWLENNFNQLKYDKIWYCINESEEDVDENALIISAGNKVKVVYGEGWWHIVFENKDEKEAYVIYYTPGGIT